MPRIAIWIPQKMNASRISRHVSRLVSMFYVSFCGSLTVIVGIEVRCTVSTAHHYRVSSSARWLHIHQQPRY